MLHIVFVENIVLKGTEVIAFLLVTGLTLITGMNNSDTCQTHPPSNHSGTIIEYFICSDDACLICEVDKETFGLNWKNEITREEIAIGGHYVSDNEKGKVNGCNSSYYSIRLFEPCNQRKYGNYTCRLNSTILHMYSLKRALSGTSTVSPNIIETENSFGNATNLKTFQCIIEELELPIYIRWILNRTSHCQTFHETWNYNSTTIKSSLTIPVEGKTEITCVVDGLFIPTQKVSLVTNVPDNNYDKTAKFIVIILGAIGTTTVVITSICIGIWKGNKRHCPRRFCRIYKQKATSNNYQTTYLDTTEGNVENMIYESYRE